MVKADDLVMFDEEHPEKFTEFEYLRARVDQIEKALDGHAEILDVNGLVVTKTETAQYFDDNEVFKALAGE